MHSKSFQLRKVGFFIQESIAFSHEVVTKITQIQTKPEQDSIIEMMHISENVEMTILIFV